MPPGNKINSLLINSSVALQLEKGKLFSSIHFLELFWYNKPKLFEIIKEGEISFNGKCILCIKCFNLCPVNVVLITSKSMNEEKYRRYKGPSRDIKPVEYRQ